VNVTGTTGTTQTWHYYRIVIPAGLPSTTVLDVSISSGTGDADLYVRRGTAPTLITYDCRPFFDGNNETCTITNPQAGEWVIGVFSYSGYAGVTVRARY
jgi:serine protease